MSKPITIRHNNELVELKALKNTKLLTKKQGKDLLIFEEGSDTPIAVYENYGASASAIDLSSLPHFAEAATTTVATVASDATASAVVGSSIPTWAYVAGGVGIVGGGAALASGGGGSSSTPPADTTAPSITSGATATAKDENSGAGAIIYTATATDASAITYSLKNTGDASLLTINSTTGAVTLTANPDYETKSAYNFTVVATDSAGNASEKAVMLAINDLDENAPVFTSATTATTAENVATTTAIYTATATDAHTLTYSFNTSGGADYTLFDLNSTTGAVTFKTSPNFEIPTDNGADNIYDFTITATDTAGNHSDQNVALSVTDVSESSYTLGQATIDLGVYGTLIAPVQVDGKWFYVWDMNGDGTHDWNRDASGQYNYYGSVTNASGTGYQYDYVTHDVLDSLFNHDINGVTNTTVANYDGNYGTTNDYRYAEINGVKLALPSTGTGLSSETINYYLIDNQTYTDLAEIWDSYNSGNGSSGTPAGWQDSNYWSATPSTYGHADVYTIYGYVDYYGDAFYDINWDYVALQVL